MDAPPRPPPPPPTPATSSPGLTPSIRAVLASVDTQPFQRWRDLNRSLELLNVFTQLPPDQYVTDHPLFGIIQQQISVLPNGRNAGTSVRVLRVGNWKIALPLRPNPDNETYVITEIPADSPTPCDAVFRQYTAFFISRATNTYVLVERSGRTFTINDRNADRFCLQVEMSDAGTLMLECDRHSFDILYVSTTDGATWVDVKQKAPAPPAAAAPPPPTRATISHSNASKFAAMIARQPNQPRIRWADARKLVGLITYFKNTLSPSRNVINHPTFGIIRYVYRDVLAGEYAGQKLPQVTLGNWRLVFPRDGTTAVIQVNNTHSPSTCDSLFEKYTRISLSSGTYILVERAAAPRTFAVTPRQNNPNRFCLQVRNANSRELQMECDNRTFDVLFVSVSGYPTWTDVRDVQ